jgi:galactokinase
MCKKNLEKLQEYYSDKSYKENMVKYLEYLNENTKKCYDYAEYIKNQMSRKDIEFDKENGSDIEKHCNELGQCIEDMVRANEKIAVELDRLFQPYVKRGDRERYAETGIYMCGCGSPGCAIHYDKK